MLFFMRRRRSFFCVLRKFSADRILSKQHIIRDGGENLENKNYLACTECKQRNYSTTKDKKVMPDRMEIKSIVNSANLTHCTKKQNN